MVKPGTKQRQQRPSETIRFRGRRITITEAGAIAFHQFGLKNFETALELYNLIIRQLPDNAEAYNNRGAVLQQLRRYPEALANYDQALAFKPAYANVHHNRGTTLNKLKRHVEALESFNEAIRLKPDHLEAYHNRGVALQELKRYDEALESYDQVLAINPDHAEASNNRGLVLTIKGDMPSAEKMFLQASTAKPDFAEPLFNLTTIRQYENAGHADLKHIRALLERTNITTEDRECLYYALGKIYDDCGHYDEAFAYYQRANEIRNTSASYAPVKVEEFTADIMEVFTDELLAQASTPVSNSRQPLFIVGMPRSGTTLLASLLSNHPAIASAGELSAMTDLASALGNNSRIKSAFPQAIRQLDAETAARLAKDYLEHLNHGISPGTTFIIDKNPLNFVNIGLITILFPKARIIHCTRDAMDTGLSTYFQRFPLRLDYAFDLRNIGHYFNQYSRLMAYWRLRPSINLIEVNYEDMVLNTGPSIRTLLDFLGLEWDEHCLSPETNPIAVETASRWQVRQPIYRRSIGRWHHYEKHLAPLMAALKGESRITA